MYKAYDMLEEFVPEADEEDLGVFAEANPEE